MIPDGLILTILYEVGATLILVMIALILIILLLLKKLVVTVTVVTVATDVSSYDHGQEVTITGTVTADDKPRAGVQVALSAKDSAGMEFPLPAATTGEDGSFKATWTIPPEFAPGTETLNATAEGMTATTTFTLTEDKPLPRKRVTK